MAETVGRYPTVPLGAGYGYRLPVYLPLICCLNKLTQKVNMSTFCAGLFALKIVVRNRSV